MPHCTNAGEGGTGLREPGLILKRDIGQRHLTWHCYWAELVGLVAWRGSEQKRKDATNLRLLWNDSTRDVYFIDDWLAVQGYEAGV